MLGVDCGGSKIAVVNVVDGEILESQEMFAIEDIPRGTALFELGFYLRRQWYPKSHRYDVWMEAPIVAGARNLQSSLRVAQVTGVVQANLHNVRDVAVSSWKKAVVGNGNTDKDGVRQWVRENHPRAYEVVGHSQDLIDAFCIGLYGDVVVDNLHSEIAGWR